MSIKLVSVGTAAIFLSGAAFADVPRVATDIAPVHSLVARVMDGVGTPDLIIAQGATPHEYSLRPSEAGALQDADLVFWIGKDLTPWMEGAMETLATDAQVISLLDADGATLLDLRKGALFEAHDHAAHGDEHAEHEHEEGHEREKEHGSHDEHDHDEHAHDKEHGSHEDSDHKDHADSHDGHAHGEHDPHAWLSPGNAAVWMNIIAAALSAADPEHAGTYFNNASTGIEEIAALSKEINTVLEPARGGGFIVFHDAYQYFEAAFDFFASGAISLSDASDPSPARIAEIQSRVTAEGINCVLSEPQFNQNLVITVMDGAKTNTAVLDPLGTDLTLGPDLYPQLLRNLANTLADCL